MLFVTQINCIWWLCNDKKNDFLDAYNIALFHNLKYLDLTATIMIYKNTVIAELKDWCATKVAISIPASPSVWVNWHMNCQSPPLLTLHSCTPFLYIHVWDLPDIPSERWVKYIWLWLTLRLIKTSLWTDCFQPIRQGKRVILIYYVQLYFFK